MTLTKRWPWLISSALHGGLVVVLVLLLTQPSAQVPGALRMRLVAPSGTPNPAASTQRPVWLPPASPTSSPLAEPQIPSWNPAGSGPTEVPTSRVPVALEELLGTTTSAAPESPSPVVGGWSGPLGSGYRPPPLPPPGLAPPQGARWNLVLQIAAGGGPCLSFEGLDSGHPELDRWLEEYLRTVSFPSSPDGQDYQLRWTLSLESGRPE